MSNKGVWESGSSGGGSANEVALKVESALTPRPCYNIYDPFMSPSTVAADLGVYEAAAPQKAIMQLA